MTDFIRQCFQTLFKREGRASRMEYLQMQLIAYSVFGLALLLYFVWWQLTALLYIGGFAALAILTAASARRLNDLGLSRLWLILLVLPVKVHFLNPQSPELLTLASFFSLFLLVYLQCCPADAGDNQQDDNTKDDGANQLFQAISDGKTEDALALVKTGANVNAKSMFGVMPLHQAIAENNQEVALALIKAGADVNAKGGLGAKPLYLAVSKNSEEVVLALIEAGADVKAEPLLLDATASGKPDIVIALIKAGADVNAKGVFGATPLHNAASANNEEVVLALIEAGADVNAKPLLQHAVVSGKPDIAITLIEAGANVNEKVWGWPLLYFAIQYIPDAIPAFVNAGADINEKTKGKTPLHYAAELGKTNAARALVNAGADVHSHNKKDKTALQVAIKKHGEESDIAQFLLSATENK